MSADRLLYPGGGDPPLDGKTPVFEEMGADPRNAPGADRPPFSVAKIGTLYLEKFGSAATAWRPAAQSIVQAFGVSTGGNTAGQTGLVQGSLVLAGVSHITASQVTGAGGATITLAGPASVLQVGGVSTGGNTLGNTGMVDGSLVFAGVSNVTLSQLTGAGGATISIIGQTSSVTAAQLAVRAGTQDATQGTVVFSNSNGISFGMSGSSQVTASYTQSTAPGALAAGTQTATSGTVVLANSNGLTFGMSGSSQITGSYSQSTAPAAFIAGTQTVTNGTIEFDDGNGVTFGLSASTITASIAAGATATGNLGGLAAGTGTVTGGTVVLSNLALNSTNGGVMSFGLSGSTVTGRVPGAIANMRIAAGTLDTTYRATAPVGVSNSVQLFIAGANVSHSALDVDSPSLTFRAVAAAAGTQTATNGTAVFADSNGLTFGMSGSSQITASYSQSTAPGALAAGTQTATSGTIVFSNSNGISFGMSGSTRVTASYTQSTAPGALAAGTQTATSGTVVLANSNGLTFGMSGSSQITGSYTQSTAPGALAAGTQTATSGTIVFSDSNGISFGLSGSTRVTASHGAATGFLLNGQGGALAASFSGQQIVFHSGAGLNVTATNVGGVQQIMVGPLSRSYFVNNGNDRGVFIGDVSQGTVHVAPFDAYVPISATRADQIMNVSNSANAAATITMRLGLYTMSGSTASQVSSTSRAWSYNSTMASSSYTQVSGTRYRSMALGTWNITPGPYMMAVQFSVSTSLTSGTHQPHGGRDVSIVADEYVLGLGSRARYWNGGFFSVTTNALPASFHITDIDQSGHNDVLFVPFVTFAGTF